jgi:hypothetical protein
MNLSAVDRVQTSLPSASEGKSLEHSAREGRPKSGKDRIVVITGSRDWTDYARIHSALRSAGECTVVHGGCRGADLLADRAARSLGYCVIGKGADWNAHGRAAGPIRNREMLDMNPDMVIYFHDDLAASKGTRDCVAQARRRGLGIYTTSPSGELIPG